MNGDVLSENTENCLTMAAGSDPQPVESSVVPDHSKPGLIPSNSLTRIAGVRNHIPYSDHNYGKPLTPPDSCSPEHPEEADTGNEEEGFTRCICGFKHDDGYMICCDKCSAWQHVECVGIKSNSVPETYLCDECDPRPLDKERAKQIQTKKIEEPTDEEEEEDGDVSDHDSDNNGLRITLPNPASIKENILTKGKRKKRDSTRKLGQKEIKHNKRKRRKRKHISSEAIPVDEDTNGPWSLSPFPGLSPEKYQEANKTVYIGDLDQQAFSVAESQMKSASFLKPEQLCKVVEVQKNKKGVVVTEDINTEKFIIECKGNLMLESKFKEENPMFPKCHPFILYYNKLDHLRLVMNFGSYGNDARFIRRSCSPTAEVRHVVVESQIRLFIVSVTPLAKGSEVTVSFEFPFHEYRRQLECACAQESCTVQKHNAAIQRVEPPNGYRNKDDHHGLSLIDSSLSNHVGFHLMDSDSEGDNSNEAKDKRSRKKLSREDRKLQQYLRQFEKMEKTEKKKQQSNGRDTKTGILTQRNLGDEYNCDTPSKPGKGFRRQSLSQRHQRKIQAIVRRTHRLPSCSSEPLSPEDNYSSAASTPTTPSVNVVEEQNDVHHHHEAAEKSFKFPKFKKGSLNDVSTSNCDLTRSNNASPEAGYTSPSKSSFEARLVEVEVSEPATLVDCERIPNLEQTPVNGCSSPRTDPNCSPSPCHSTYASPTRSESVDFSDVAFRHCLASPTAGCVASYLLNQKTLKSSYCHTTLKKRWLLKYMSENTPDKRPNGLVSTNSIKPNDIMRASSPRTFPLPYKRRKLLEYRNTVNNRPVLSRTNVTTVSQTVDNDTVLQALSSAISGSVPSISSVSPTLLTPSLSNGVMSVTSSDVRDSISQHSSPIPRNAAGCDETGSERSSLSSISSTEDIKSDLTLTETRMETNSSVTVDSSTGCGIKPLSCNVLSSTQNVEDTSLDVSTNGVAAGDEGSSRDTMAHVGSTIEGSGHTTTAGGKKKVSLSEYLNRKRTSTPAGKKESCPASSSEVSSPSQSRVSETTSIALSTDPISSAVNYRSLNCSSTSSTYGTTPSQSRVPATTSAALSVDPVSSAVNYRALSCNGSASSTYGTTPSQSRVSATTNSALSTDVVSSAVNYKSLSCSSSISSTYGTTPSQSRVSATSAALSTDVVSSAVNYRSLICNSTSTTYGTTLLSSSVSSSTGGVLIEPVSPDEGYRVDDDRPLLHTTQDLGSSLVVREAKPSVVRDSYFNSLTRPVRPVSEPGSSSDAMDIEEDDAPSSSTILVNTPVMSAPGGGPIARSSLSGLGTNYSPLHQVKLNNVSSAQSTAVHQINDTLVSPDTLRRRPGLITARIPNPSMQTVARHQDFHCASGRPTPFH